MMKSLLGHIQMAKPRASLTDNSSVTYIYVCMYIPISRRKHMLWVFIRITSRNKNMSIFRAGNLWLDKWILPIHLSEDKLIKLDNSTTLIRVIINKFSETNEGY